VNRTTVTSVWIGGVVLMVLLYLIGPQHFIQACEDLVARIWWTLADLVESLMLRAFDAVRAAAIALYVVFVVLGIMARRRGIHVGGVLLIVTVLFLILVRTNWYDPGTKWFSAAVLAAVGAATMTGRLLHAPPARDPARPWGNAPTGAPAGAPTGSPTGGRSDSSPAP